MNADYARNLFNIMRMLSVSVSIARVAERLNRGPATARRFWVMPGRTSVWWNGFVNRTAIPEESRGDFRVAYQQHACSMRDAVVFPSFKLAFVDSQKRFGYVGCGRDVFENREKIFSVFKKYRTRAELN